MNKNTIDGQGPKSNVNVTYIGGPTAIFEIGGLRLITDPTLDPAGNIYHSGTLIHEKIKGPITTDIGKIDLVLLSHDQHYDNLDNGGRLLLQTVPKTFTTLSGAERLKGTSIGLNTWQTVSVSAPDGTVINITATPARHGPAGIEPLQGEVTGFLLSVEGDYPVQIYITGDTTFYDGVEEVANRFHPQYVFLFAGAAQVRGPFNVTMGTNDAMDTAIAFPNATIIPLHYEGWKHYTQNEKDIQQSYQVLGVEQRFKILEAGVATPL
ncbi:MAG TPA: MBL fold metallo-hydrolase [Ferruginibacter sp.]|nr:MBL fold metallo-hydrolase [Ferruginibacter sp.]